METQLIIKIYLKNIRWRGKNVSNKDRRTRSELKIFKYKDSVKNIDTLPKMFTSLVNKV